MLHTPDDEGMFARDFTEGFLITTSECDVFRAEQGRWVFHAPARIVRNLQSSFEATTGNTSYTVTFSKATPDVFHNAPQTMFHYDQAEEHYEKEFQTRYPTGRPSKHEKKYSRKPTNYNVFMQETLCRMAQNGDDEASTRMSRAAQLWNDTK